MKHATAVRIVVVAGVLVGSMEACEQGAREHRAAPHTTAEPPAMPAVSQPRVQTSAEALLAGKHEVGTDVVADLVVLRAPFLRIKTGGRQRHFAFAVAAESEFLARLGDLQKELADFLAKEMPRARKALKSPKGAIVEVTYGERIIRAVQNLYPDPTQVIAIELENTIEDVDWIQVSDAAARTERLAQVPWLSEDGKSKWSLDGYPIEIMPVNGTSIEGAMAQVSELLKATPPKMDQLVPNLDEIALNHSRASDVSAYNRLACAGLGAARSELASRNHLPITAEMR